MSPAGVNSLPDELVKEVLSDILLVSEDDFAHAGPSSPFGCKPLPSSEVLLVSKRWLRIGSPLFHECVVLRNSAQAGAFHRFIKGKIGGQVKGYVRRVRLEGNFGAIIGKIFAALPNVTDLNLPLPSSGKDNVKGLVQGLSNVNPDRVILGTFGQTVWKNSSMILGILSERVKQWAKLRIVELHYERGFTYYSAQQSFYRFYESLSLAPSLEQVILSCPNRALCPVEQAHLGVLFTAIGRTASLRAIHVYISDESAVEEARNQLIGNPYARKVDFHPKQTRIVSLQMCNESDHIPTLPEDVLRLIIEIDLWACLGNDPLSVTMERVKSYRLRARELLCVSKTFYKLASALVPCFIAICQPKSFLPVWKKIEENADISSSMNVLVLSRFEDTKYAIGPSFRARVQGDTKEEKVFCGIVSSLRNVRHLYFDTEFESILDRMPDETKLGVRSLRLQLTVNSFRQWTLVQFKSLTALVLNADRGLEFIIRNGINSRPSFDHLTTLKIYNRYRRLDVISLIRSCDFPSVQSLHFVLGDFGTLKWKETQDAYLPSFPKVQVIRFEGVDSEGIITPPITVQELSSEEIDNLVVLFTPSTRETISGDLEDIVEIFDSIKFDKLTALRELQLESVKEWPWQDRELKDNSWQELAHTLVDTYGFQITDGRGVPWKPRLMKRANKKKRVS